jgi:hypothetical protein
MRKTVAASCIVLAAAYFAARPQASPAPLPPDARALAARVAAHPADWAAASALAEKALDAPVRSPKALWHASGALAISLAPALAAPRAAFARAAFFHWTELSAAERKEVLDAYGPLLRDWQTFNASYLAVYALTGDFDYLLRFEPDNPEAKQYLADLAATNGLFDQYRRLRAEIGDNVQARRTIASQQVEATRSVNVALKPDAADEVPPYVEIFVDGALRAEGPLAAPQTLTATVGGAGRHAVDIDLANPATRNRMPRRIHVVSVQGF